jgi:hypothetical protein
MPSLELQTIKIWNDTRYKSFGKDAYEWTHHFLVIEDFGHFHGIVALTNRWTLDGQDKVGSPVLPGPKLSSNHRARAFNGFSSVS